MARAPDRRADRADRPFQSRHDALGARRHFTPGPLPLRDFLPRLQAFTRLVPVRVWRRGGWQVVWIVIRSLDLVHVASNRGRIKDGVPQERQS